MSTTPKKISPPITNLIEAPSSVDELIDNNQQSAKRGIKILLEKKNATYKKLTSIETNNLVIAFPSKRKIVYGKAFDIVKIENSAKINFLDIESIKSNIKNIIVCEIKSTRKQTKKEKFEGYFFWVNNRGIASCSKPKRKLSICLCKHPYKGYT